MTNLLARIYFETLKVFCIGIFIVVGCERPDTSLAPPPVEQAPVDSIDDVQRNILVSPGEDRLERILTGPYRVQYIHLETGLIVDEMAVDFVDSWPFKFSPQRFISGRFEVTIYQDNLGNARLDDCPFPPRATDSFNLDGIDSLQGRRQLDLPLAQDVSIKLVPRTCGLGTQATGLKAQLKNQSAVAQGELFLYAEGQIPSLSPNVNSAFIFPIEPGTIDAGASLHFSISELLEGTYTLTLFADGDGNGMPTPCNVGVGGGDRFISTMEGVEVIEGQVTEISDVFEFTDRDCRDPFTGVQGALVLGQGASMDETESGQIGLYDGSVLVRFRSLGSDEKTVTWVLSDSISQRLFPQRFTVTGLTPGEWAVTVFVDRDENGSYTPCDGLPSGFDTIWANIDDVTITEGKVVDLGDIVLETKSCGQNALSGIRGEFLFEIADGPQGSGRPVRLELIDQDSDGDRTTFLLLDNHWKAGNTSREFIVEVEPGRYRGRIYLDSNRDGVFTSCTDDLSGDLMFTSQMDVDLSLGEIVELGITEGVENSCVPVEYPFNIVLEKVFPLDSNADKIRLAITEQGGWQRDIPLVLTAVGDVWTAEPVLLAQGRYGLAIYQDEDDNGVYEPCIEDGADRFAVQVEMEIGGANDTPQIQLTLKDICAD